MQEVMNKAISNLVTNKGKIDKLLGENEAIVGTFSPDVEQAMHTLLRTFGADGRIAAQMIVAKVQNEQLVEASTEIGSLIAAAQIVLGDETLLDAVQSQATANTEVAGNPLSDAAAGSKLSAADKVGADDQANASAPAESGQV